jgi:hypothetical protein
MNQRASITLLSGRNHLTKVDVYVKVIPIKKPYKSMWEGMINVYLATVVAASLNAVVAHAQSTGFAAVWRPGTGTQW